MSGMEQEVSTLFKVGRNLAASDAWPTWNEGNEFKAIREASLEE